MADLDELYRALHEVLVVVVVVGIGGLYPGGGGGGGGSGGGGDGGGGDWVRLVGRLNIFKRFFTKLEN